MSSNDDDNKDNRFIFNIWTHILVHAKNGICITNTIFCFTYNGMTVLTFHADKSKHAGNVYRKCFKFFRPGLFALHAKDFKDSIPPSNCRVKNWKDSALLWIDLKRNYRKKGQLMK